MTTTVRPSFLAVGLGVLAVATVLAIRAPWAADAAAARASNVAVDCEPAQRVLVRQIVASSGDPQITVQCVSGPAAQRVAYVDASGRVYQAGAPLAGPAVVPVVYNTPVVSTPVVTERQVVREEVDREVAPEIDREVAQPAPVQRTSTASTTSTPSTSTAGTPKRNWKKTAIVIGGSAGAGAGIGAIIGGKKGAAIGAAIGGGAGTLYEVVKK